MTTPSAEKIIVVKNLVKTFKDFRAVDDISFEVEAGKIFAFSGRTAPARPPPSKCSPPPSRPRQGTILLDGNDPRKNPLEARRSFGIVFQDPSLDSELTARENMKLHAVLYSVPWGEHAARIEAALKFVGLWDRRDSLTKTYSGGMKRRLEIAPLAPPHPAHPFPRRADARPRSPDPQPHLGIHPDPRPRTENDCLFHHALHDEADRVADDIAIIDSGRIVASGPPAELKRNAGAATLEEAFISLTGHAIREEQASAKTACAR